MRKDYSSNKSAQTEDVLITKNVVDINVPKKLSVVEIF